MAEDVVAECSNGLLVAAQIAPSAETFDFLDNLSFSNTKIFIFGSVTVINPGMESVMFSTAHLSLGCSGSARSRGYKKSIASEVIDFSGVEIKPGEVMLLDMYWGTSLAEGGIVEKVNIRCSSAP